MLVRTKKILVLAIIVVALLLFRWQLFQKARFDKSAASTSRSLSSFVNSLSNAPVGYATSTALPVEDGDWLAVVDSEYVSASDVQFQGNNRNLTLAVEISEFAHAHRHVHQLLLLSNTKILASCEFATRAIISPECFVWRVHDHHVDVKILKRAVGGSWNTVELQ